MLHSEKIKLASGRFWFFNSPRLTITLQRFLKRSCSRGQFQLISMKASLSEGLYEIFPTIKSDEQSGANN